MIIPYIYIKYLLYAIFFVGFPVLTLILLKIIQKRTLGKCKSLICLTGKTAIVTGGTTGIGYETALVLASRGCRVIIADKESGVRAKNKIIQLTNNDNIVIKHVDLASLRSVRKFAKEINETEQRLDILINNAGVSTVGNQHTEDGLHETMQINHFGPFLLTHLLVDLLKKSAPSRIIFVSSAFSFFSNLSVENLNYPKHHPLSLFRTGLIYGNSKLCNIISANGFAERLEDYGITCNSLHPGWVNKKILRSADEWLGLDGIDQMILSPISYIYAKSPKEGAQTSLHLALSNSVKDVSGKHFWDCITFPLPPGARNKKFCRDIWEESEILVKLQKNEKLLTLNLENTAQCLKEEAVLVETIISNEQPNINEIEENLQNQLNQNEAKNLNTTNLKCATQNNSFDEEIEMMKIDNVDDNSGESGIEAEIDSNNPETIELKRRDRNESVRFRKSKNREGFLTINGGIDYNKAKDRS